MTFAYEKDLEIEISCKANLILAKIADFYYKKPSQPASQPEEGTKKTVPIFFITHFYFSHLT